MARNVSVLRWPALLLVLLAIGGMPLRGLAGAPLAGVAICHAGTGQPPDRSPLDCDHCPFCLAAGCETPGLTPASEALVPPALVPRIVAWAPTYRRPSWTVRLRTVQARAPPGLA